MRKMLTALFLAVALATLTGCPTTPTAGQSSSVTVPKSSTQTVYALEVSLTTATNALADLHQAGVVVGANYATAYDIQKRAHATLLEARKASMAKDATKTEVLLHTLSGLIDQIAVYNGGKR